MERFGRVARRMAVLICEDGKAALGSPVACIVVAELDGYD